MSSRVLARVLLSALAGALCGVAVTCGLLVTRSPDTTTLARPAAAERPAAAVTGRAREVLRRWDDARARAWTSGDVEALTRIYTPGSVAGRRDAAMLRSWTDRGVRVSDLRTQVLRLQVLVEQERRLVLVVTDRVAQVRAGPLVLPHDRPSTRRIVLARRAVADWRVVSVSRERPGRS